MSEFTPIKIDIDVYRAIEAKRTGFDQEHNDILREVFDLGTKPHDPVAPLLHDAVGTQQQAGTAGGMGPGGAVDHTPPTGNRRTGLFTVELRGKSFDAHNLREAYMLCLRLLSDLDPSFLDELSRRQTRARRIVARRKEDLYKNNPRLAAKFAMQLSVDWWVDTNLSRGQCEVRLRAACEVAGVGFGSDLKLKQAA